MAQAKVRYSTVRRALITLILMLVPLLTLLARQQPAQAQAAVWTPIGPPGAQGIVAFVVDPADTNNIFVGTYSGQGIWRTTNGGVSWTQSDFRSPVQALAFLPTSQPAILAGLYDSNPANPAPVIYRSTDQGSSWNPVTSGIAAGTSSVLLFAVDPNNPSIVFAESDSGLYKSVDAGVSWNLSDSSLPPNVTSLAVDPTNSNRVFAGVVGGVYRSDDAGASWVRASNGFPQTADITISELELTTIDPAIIYADVRGPSLERTTTGLYRSYNAGANWSRIIASPSTSGAFSALAVNTAMPNIVYAGFDGGVLRTDNGGANWEDISAGLAGDYIGEIAVVSNVIFATANNNELYRFGAAPPPATPTPVSPPPSPQPSPQPALVNLSVARIEVTQAIQNTSRSVKLVRDRPSIARVHLSVEGNQDVQGVAALLYGARNGQQLPGSPLRPINPGGSIVAARSPNAERFDHTLNFVIPSSWHADGIMALSAHVDPENRISERNEDDNRSPAYPTVYFELPRMRVVLVPIEYQRERGGPILRVDPKSLPLYGLQGAYDMLPFGPIAIEVHSPLRVTGDLSGERAFANLLHVLEQIRLRESTNKSRGTAYTLPKYYGLLPESPEHPYPFNGVAYVDSAVGLGIGSRLDTTAHELGHTFGLEHVNCGGSTFPENNFPIDDGRIGDIGLNVRLRQPVPAWHADIMTYCRPRWISGHHSDLIFQVLNDQRTRQATLTQAEQSAWLVSGSIASGGLSGSLDFAEPISSTTTVEAGGSGAYRIELWRNTELVFSHGFDAATPEAPVGALEASFAFVIPRPADITELRLLAGDVLLDSISVGAAAPTVTALLAPPGQNADERVVQWTKSPATGELDVVTVRYSVDAGQSWKVLGQTAEPAVSSLSFNLSDLAQSANGLLEVVVTRGATSGSARVNIGPIANKPPDVQIVQGQRLRVTTSEPIVLLASANDREDGSLPDERYSWRDSAGLLVGNGPLLELPPLDTFKQRLITVTVSDSAGATMQASVLITAGERIYLPALRR